MKKKIYKYEIWASRYGGEHVTGTIPEPVADYWLDKGQDALEEYMFAWHEDKVKLEKSIPEEFHLGEWHEINDIEHQCCGEFEKSNVLTVYDADTNEEIAEIDMTDDLITGEIDDPAKTYKETATTSSLTLFYGQSFEKGGFPYETIETDKPFDASKLKVSLTNWSGLKLIHAIEYDGESYCASGGDTIGKSMNCWIEDYR